MKEVEMSEVKSWNELAVMCGELAESLVYSDCLAGANAIVEVGKRCRQSQRAHRDELERFVLSQCRSLKAAAK